MAKIYIQKTERAKLEHIILTQSQKAEDNTIVLKKINRQYNSELLNYLIKDVITVVNYYLDDEINVNIVAHINKRRSLINISIIIYNTFINYKLYYLHTFEYIIKIQYVVIYNKRNATAIYYYMDHMIHHLNYAI